MSGRREEWSRQRRGGPHHGDRRRDRSGVPAALEATGTAENTLVILTSDNGFAPYAGAKNWKPTDITRVVHYVVTRPMCLKEATAFRSSFAGRQS